MTKEQLAEREYPVLNSMLADKDGVFRRIDENKDNRAAFIKGLDHLPEFLAWVNKNAGIRVKSGNYIQVSESGIIVRSPKKVIEDFLTEKYGSNE